LNEDINVLFEKEIEFYKI